MDTEISLAGWDIEKFDDVPWGPWGSQMAPSPIGTYATRLR